MEERECECGKKHGTNAANIIINDNAHILLKEKLELINKKVLVVVEECNFELAKEIFKSASFLCLDIEPTTFFAESIEGKDEQLIVAFGGESLISVCKYYCSSLGLDLIAVVVGDCMDYTFSCFSRLYDGVEFCFYNTPSLKEIYYPISLNKYDNIYENYIASKYIAFFDNVVGKLIYKVNTCERLEKFFKNVLLSYNYNQRQSDADKLKNAVEFLSKLGQGMTYFEQTKYFFGGERAVTERLAIFNKRAPYKDLNYISLKLLINCYSCFFSSYPFDGNGNLSKQINMLSEIMKVSPSTILSRLAPSELVYEDSVKQTFSGYYPYLKGVLNKCLKKIFLITSGLNINIMPNKKYNLTAKAIEKSLALSSVTYLKPCTLHLMFVFGYLDKLL